VWLSRPTAPASGRTPSFTITSATCTGRLGRKTEAVEQWTTAVRMIHKLREDQLDNGDERRVWNTTQRKIEDAHAGREPAVAPVVAPGPPRRNR